jgi:riboflavin kinase / FMN adenylyltransferase
VKVYHDIYSFPKLPFPIVTTGTFDGVHLGHCTILEKLKSYRLVSGHETVVITFNPHPRLVLQPDDNKLELLNSLDEKIELLSKQGIDHLLVIPFDKNFAALSSLEFIEQILVKTIGTKKLVIGHDHHFGKNREGSFENLRQSGPQYGFEVEEIPAKDINHVAISSTKIREALHNGDIITANKFLGYQYKMEGVVVKGRQLGDTIGFPTANLEIIGQRKLIPQNGVYAVTVSIDNSIYQGMMNIGNRPTVETNGERKVEVHILNFSGNLYGKKLQISCVDRIRDEKKFTSLDELKSQLNEDKNQIKSLLSSD